ncbi:hypothetical protein [Thalassospira sp.]|uniref:hypothetical protein n=1 Tax=Thalassospira sp. TaxID=1912094 RepID=UPI0027343213|nr:hypothetical protein [Thalassospira sp.]MDP2698714.1 hypothetical protein [Thalassospira sp.]
MAEFLAPVWMMMATGLARAGGLVILLILGRHFSAGLLAPYFNALIMAGVGVTIIQAGCGPLLVRLAQTAQHRILLMLLGLRLILAGMVIVILAPMLPLATWPVLLMPICAALAPDWLMTARLQFSRLTLLAAIAQLAGIVMAVFAVGSDSVNGLVWCAPIISLVACLGAGCFAVSNHPLPVPKLAPLPARTIMTLVVMTLLAGLLPNLDIALLAGKLSSADHTALMMAHRLVLLASALFAGIASALFAQKSVGWRRDIWLLLPGVLIALPMLILPDMVIRVIYQNPVAGLAELLRIASLWPLLTGFVLRQILVWQENPGGLWPAIAALLLFVGGAVVLALMPEWTAQTVLIAMTVKLGFLAALLSLVGRFSVMQRQMA